MKKNSILILVACFISMLFMIQPVFAINASSSNYSIGMFGTGMATSNGSSTNYESLSLTESQGTTRNAESDNYLSNIGFFNNTPYSRTVIINSYSVYPDSAVEGSIIGFKVSAVNSESIWLKLTLPNSTEEIISLSNNVYSYYVADLVGTYNVAFYANSSTGALSIVLDSFEITSPVVIPPSGGGVKCKYIWDCSSWSVCSPDGQQTRICKNTGTCEGTEGKPIEERNCSEALFDVKLNLEQLELNKEDSLSFDVELIQTKSTEKIDVQVRYSVIDKDKDEIFSKVETRAVETNISYKEVLEELVLIPGNYTLRIEIIYGDLQKAFAEQNFEVIGGKIETGIPEQVPEKGGIGSFFEKLNYKTLLLIALLIGSSLLIFWIIFIIIKRRRKEEGNIIDKNLREGTRVLNMKNILKAMAIYENLRRIYVSRRDPTKETYNKIKEFHKNILKSKALIITIGVGLAIVLFQFLFSSNVFEKVKLTGNVINLGSGNGRLIFILIFSALLIFILIFLFWKRIKKLFKKEPPENTISGLIGKKVYSSDGYLIGEVNEVILEKKRIHSLKIALDKKHKAGKKGIVVEYKNVKSIKNVVIIEEGVISHLE